MNDIYCPRCNHSYEASGCHEEDHGEWDSGEDKVEDLL